LNARGCLPALPTHNLVSRDELARKKRNSPEHVNGKAEKTSTQGSKIQKRKPTLNQIIGIAGTNFHLCPVVDNLELSPNVSRRLSLETGM
jgi:hypothetical protein